MGLTRSRDDRRIASLKAFLRVDDAWGEVAIANVSTSGLMVRSSLAPATGTAIELQRRGLTLQGAVVWSTSTRFGVRSFEPIDLSGLFAQSELCATGRQAGSFEAMPEEDRRSIDRKDAHTNVEVRMSGRLLSAHLQDVSAFGCRIKYKPGTFAQGDRVAIKFLQNITVLGTVAWLLGDWVGVEFDNPMHDAIAAHLGFSPAPISVPAQPRDHFGRAVPSLRLPIGRGLP